MKQSKPKEPVQFIGQGTYGCAYKPNIPCKNEKQFEKGKAFISKIQKSTPEVEREERFGKYITENIRDYNSRFAPILNSCDINIDQIAPREAEKCNIIMSELEKQRYYGKSAKDAKFKTYRQKYAGKNSLGDHFIAILKRTPHQLFKKMIESNLYLLESLSKLLNIKEHPIVHYDLKENNIIYNDTENHPIIIDFGLSIELPDISTYNKESALSNYYVYYGKYPPWCLEIVLLSYIAQVLVNDQHVDIKTAKISPGDIDSLLGVLDEYVKENEVFRTGEMATGIAKFSHEWTTYISTFLDKTWQELYIDLQQSYKTWDNYSLAVIFYFMIYDILYENDIDNPIIHKYSNNLQRIILASPKKRQTIQETMKTIRHFSKNVNIKDYRELIYSISSLPEGVHHMTAKRVKSNKRYMIR